MAENAKIIAENALPGWKAVDVSVEDRPTKRGTVDSRGVNFESLRSKYFTTDSATAKGWISHTSWLTGDDDAEFVTMRPRRSSLSQSGEKTVVVSGDKVVGVQG